LIDLLTGASTTLTIADIAGLFSPFSDPLGFVMHPLITPIIPGSGSSGWKPDNHSSSGLIVTGIRNMSTFARI
jgi:hypothetical protein